MGNRCFTFSKSGATLATDLQKAVPFGSSKYFEVQLFICLLDLLAFRLTKVDGKIFGIRFGRRLRWSPQRLTWSTKYTKYTNQLLGGPEEVGAKSKFQSLTKIWWWQLATQRTDDNRTIKQLALIETNERLRVDNLSSWAMTAMIVLYGSYDPFNSLESLWLKCFWWWANEVTPKASLEHFVQSYGRLLSLQLSTKPMQSTKSIQQENSRRQLQFAQGSRAISARWKHGQALKLRLSHGVFAKVLRKSVV